MGALLARLAAAGIRVEPLGDGNLRAFGVRSDDHRALIREHKSAILDELVVNDEGSGETPEQAAELRQLVSIVAVDWSADEVAEALSMALADPEAALDCFRALVAESEATAPPATEGDPWMRTCRQCANLTLAGRCLAAWRGESFGDGIAVRRDFAPLDPDRPQRCAAYSPGPADPDRRTGSERWP